SQSRAEEPESQAKQSSDAMSRPTSDFLKSHPRLMNGYRAVVERADQPTGLADRGECGGDTAGELPACGARLESPRDVTVPELLSWLVEAPLRWPVVSLRNRLARVAT